MSDSDSDDLIEDILPGLAALDLHVPQSGEYSDLSDLTDLESDSETDDQPANEEDDSLEPGEIVQDTGQTTAKKEKGNKRRHQRRARANAKQSREEQEALRAEKAKMIPYIAALYGEDASRFHIHLVQRSPSSLHKLQKRESEKGGPLSRADVDELVPDSTWIYEPGIHIGYLSEDGRETLTVVLAVKIRSWDEMQDSTRSHVQEVLQVVMDWGGVVGSIKNNKAMKPPPRPHDDTGRYGGNSTDIKPRGIMYALGWHLSMELGKSLVYYAPKGRKEKTLELYDELLAKFPSVAELYRDDLATLFPGGLKQLQDDADRHGVLSFADLLDGVSRQRPFANSLTVTREEFANQEHKDKDKSFVAKGKWWEAQKDGNRWIFDRNADHDKTKGGEFYWGEYGIGVDFQKTKGLVDILWRGQLDFHATLRSFDTPGSTRFGTSIQITAKGVNAMEKVWDVKSLVECGHDVHKLSPKSAARVTTPHNRLEKARLPPRKKPKTKKGQ